MTTSHDSTTIQINRRTYKTEKHTNNSYQKVPVMLFNTPDARFVHTRLSCDAQIKNKPTAKTST